MQFTDKKIKENLQNFGGAIKMDEDACKKMRAFLLSKVYESKRDRVVFKEKIKVIRDWMGLNWITVRIATISVIVLSVLGGSISTVSASLQSVPGDFLFPVKITAEKIQIALKTDESEKTKLKVAFAGRRLEEAKKIIKSKNPEKEANAELAMENFKTQIKNIEKENLTQAESEIKVEIDKMVMEAEKITNIYSVASENIILDEPAIVESEKIAKSDKNSTLDVATGEENLENAQTVVASNTNKIKSVAAPQDSEESFKIELQMIEEGNPDKIEF